MKGIVTIDAIQQKILLIRGQRVMIDADLAALYGVTTKRLNEQVKRNRKRFPEDFMFQLNRKEKSEVVANCDHLKNLKYSPFTSRFYRIRRYHACYSPEQSHSHRSKHPGSSGICKTS